MKLPIIDNRDQNTTWFWSKDETFYIEIDPEEIMANMLENCYNEDVLFLFGTFINYLNMEDHLDPDIKETSKDYVVGFRDYLTKMIEDSACARASGQPINPDTPQER